MPAPRPTLRSLATIAGVSPMTVSLALRNSREVSAATRRRIQRLALSHGYRPDPIVSRLMHHLRQQRPHRFQANIAALTHPWPQRRGPIEGYIERLTKGLTLRATALGFAFSSFDLDDFTSGDQLQRLLLSRGVEGIVILPLRRATNLNGLLDWSLFSTVCTTPSLIAPRFHSAMPNHFDNMLAVCRGLTQAGYNRIGLAVSSDWNQRVKHRWAGGMAWQNLFGGTHPVPPLVTQQPGPDLEVDIFAAWLVRERPDAIVIDATSHASLAAGLGHLPKSERPKVVTMNWPDDTCDAGIDQLPEHLGTATIDVLAGMVARGEKGVPAIPAITMLEGRWVSGKLEEKDRRQKITRTPRARAK